MLNSYGFIHFSYVGLKPEKTTFLKRRSEFDFGCCSDGIFKFDGLVSEILSIALPAALSLVADPIASLLDTAFVGHIGTEFVAHIVVLCFVHVRKLFLFS